MRYQGSGDSSIHLTQLAVTAAMINRGINTDETVAKVLAATRKAAGHPGTRWDWRREERDIRARCVTWQRKKLNGQRRHTPSERRSGVTTMEELGTMVFPPVTFLVPELIPADVVTLICSKPKVGKSWLLLDLCISAATDRDMATASRRRGTRCTLPSRTASGACNPADRNCCYLLLSRGRKI